MVLFPPLTYMLKFSRGVCFTSCYTHNVQPHGKHVHNQHMFSRYAPTHYVEVSTTCCTRTWYNAKALALTAHSNNTPYRWQHREMVWPWIKQAFAHNPKVHIAFNSSWFTDCCNSQVLMHLAAFFIIYWAKTSIAKHFCTAHAVATSNCWWGITAGTYTVHKHSSPQATHAACRHEAAHIRSHSRQCWRLCKWSFRRFTYRNLVTTSPSSKW